MVGSILRPRGAPLDPRELQGVAPRLWSGLVELPGAPLFAPSAVGKGGDPMELFALLAPSVWAKVRGARPPQKRPAAWWAHRDDGELADVPPRQPRRKQHRERADMLEKEMEVGEQATAASNLGRGGTGSNPQASQSFAAGSGGSRTAPAGGGCSLVSLAVQPDNVESHHVNEEDDFLQDEPARKEPRCSECKKTGHNKRSCPDAAEDQPAQAAEKPKAKKGRSIAAEPLSSEQIMATFGGLCTNAGYVDCSCLEDILEQIQCRQYVIFGVVYGSMHTNMRPVPKGTPTAPTPKSCRKVMGVSLYLPPEEGDFPSVHSGQGARCKRMIYVPLDKQAGYESTLEERWRLLQKLFTDEVGAKLVSYHAHECLVHLLPGLVQRDVLRTRISCLVVMSWLLDSESVKTPFLDLAGRFGGGFAVAGADSSPTGARVWDDLECCSVVYEALNRAVREGGLGRAGNEEETFVPMLAVMQSQGIGFSPASLLKYKKDMEKAVAAIEEEAFRIVGHPFLLSSPLQVCTVLYEELKLPPPNSRAGEVGSMIKFKAANQAHTTNEETLQRLTKLHPLPAIILEHRHVNKMLTGFMTPLAEKAAKQGSFSQSGTCTIYTNFLHTGTATGRLSAADPNLQNVPKIDSMRFEGRNDITRMINVRDAFVGRSGRLLLSADYVQCEIRILAHFSNDPKLIALLQDPEACPYVSVASCVTGRPTSSVTPQERSTFKTVMLGLVYGLGVKTLASKLNTSEGAAFQHIQSFYKTFPCVKSFQNRVVADARNLGHVETWGGRRRALPDLKLSGQAMSGRRSYAERQAVNTVVQGSAADMVKVAMRELSLALHDRGLSDKAKLCLQIHDEILLEVEESAIEEVSGIVSECMVGSIQLKVPMRVKLVAGKSWGTMLPYDAGVAQEGGADARDDCDSFGVVEEEGFDVPPGEEEEEEEEGGADEIADADEMERELGSGTNVAGAFAGEDVSGGQHGRDSIGEECDLGDSTPGKELAGAVRGREPSQVGPSVDMFDDLFSEAPRPNITYVNVQLAGQSSSAPPLQRGRQQPQGGATASAGKPQRVSLFGGMIRPAGAPSPHASQGFVGGGLSRPPLHDIAVGGLNTKVFAANKLAGGLHGTAWSKNLGLAPSLSASSIVDDDLDQLEIDD